MNQNHVRRTFYSLALAVTGLLSLPASGCTSNVAPAEAEATGTRAEPLQTPGMQYTWSFYGPCWSGSSSGVSNLPAPKPRSSRPASTLLPPRSKRSPIVPETGICA